MNSLKGFSLQIHNPCNLSGANYCFNHPFDFYTTLQITMLIDQDKR